MRATTHIKTLYEQFNDQTEKPQRETWSLVDADGERRVLFEAYEEEASNTTAPFERQIMTLRESLRGPRQVARQIWLALDD